MTRTLENYVDGQWRSPSGSSGNPIVNPATGEAIATVDYTYEEDIDAVVAAGRAAFQEWGETPVEERIQPASVFT